MALTPFTVHVQTEPGKSFGQVMSEIRSWLDHQHIEPSLFKPVVRDQAVTGFEITFESKEEAQRFQRGFCVNSNKRQKGRSRTLRRLAMHNLLDRVGSHAASA